MQGLATIKFHWPVMVSRFALIASSLLIIVLARRWPTSDIYPCCVCAQWTIVIVMVSLHVNYDFLRLSSSVALVSMLMRKINVSLLRIHSNNYVCLRFRYWKEVFGRVTYNDQSGCIFLLVMSFSL